MIITVSLVNIHCLMRFYISNRLLGDGDAAAPHLDLQGSKDLWAL